MRKLNKSQTLELLQQGAVIEVDRRLGYYIGARLNHDWKGYVGKAAFTSLRKNLLIKLSKTVSISEEEYMLSSLVKEETKYE